MLGPSQSLDVEHKASTGTVVLKKTYLPKGWVNYCKVLYRVFFSRCDFCPILACIMGGKLEGMGIIGWLVHHHFPLTRRRHKARKWCASLPPGPSFSPRRMRRLSYHSLPPRRQNRPSNDRADTAIQHGRGGRRDMGVLYRWRRLSPSPKGRLLLSFSLGGRRTGEGGGRRRKLDFGGMGGCARSRRSKLWPATTTTTAIGDTEQVSGMCSTRLSGDREIDPILKGK